jgi:secreted PhoX family phosphatase
MKRRYVSSRLVLSTFVTLGLTTGCDDAAEIEPSTAPLAEEARALAQPGVPADAPLSAVVAVVYDHDRDPAAPCGGGGMAGYVRRLVHEAWRGNATPGFPLANDAISEEVRTLPALRAQVVVKWFDPLTPSDALDAPRFGAGSDYNAFFGDGWNADRHNSPFWNGNPHAGWMWSNHEYVGNARPTATTAPTGEMLTLARFLAFAGVLDNDVTSNLWSPAALSRYFIALKRQIGGSWYRLEQDRHTLDWHLVRHPDALRFDATDHTLFAVTGFHDYAPDHDDAGHPLPAGVVTGLSNQCAGGVTPWGTVMSAEEDWQYLYGPLETCFDAQRKFIPGAGCDPGAPITLDASPSPTGILGPILDPAQQHRKDRTGFVSEIDPGVPPGEYYGAHHPGVGHRKVGGMGKSEFEAATFAVDASWRLRDNRRVVMYSGVDLRGGRLYKLVSKRVYRRHMSRAQVRALLDEGDLYVSHFEDLDNATGYKLYSTGQVPSEAAPGHGRWIRLGLDNHSQLAPNAAALGDPTRTVGAALADDQWNGMGGFTSDDHVHMALFTAGMKLGVSELNRPEDMEWNPRDPSGHPRLYVSFTQHTTRTVLHQDGTLIPTAEHDAALPRTDRYGSVFAVEEENTDDPARSEGFRYFAVVLGRAGQGPFDFSNPDNIVLDAQGGVWFGTDGNVSANGRPDALYYLDLEPAHRNGATPTYGLPFRVVQGPSDTEMTGPFFNSDTSTLFFSAQHPGEGRPSQWPQPR